MVKDDGGRAFPLAHDDSGDTCVQSGMSLRDYFAAKAMPSVMESLAGISLPKRATEEVVASAIANSAYIIADAMLAERNK